MSLFRDDTGTVIEIDVVRPDGKPRDISAATTLEIHVLKPSGVFVTKPATLSTDGKDGRMQFTTGAGDLDEAGEYRLQGHVVTPTEDFHTSKSSLPVRELLENHP